MNVAILGASQKPDRYAYKAFKKLTQHGHRVFLVHPQLQDVEGVKVFKTLQDISEPIDTLTMYVGPKISSDLKDDILSLKPQRVIFNPGSENAELSRDLQRSEIKVQEDCTLVLLSLNQFEY